MTMLAHRRPIRRLLPAAAAAALGLAAMTASPAGAESKSTYPPEVETHCSDDYFRHCSPYELGSTALRRCMEAKSRDLSPNCKQALKRAGYVRSGKHR